MTSTSVGGRASYCNMQIPYLSLSLNVDVRQICVTVMNINIMKSLTVHGTGFTLLLHVSVLTGSSFRPSPELIIVVT